MKLNALYNLFARMARAAVLSVAVPTVIMFVGPAVSSAAMIRLVPSSTFVMVDEIFSLDLIATDIGLGGYDVTFSYSPLLALIDESLVTFDTHLGGPANSFPLLFAGLDTLELAEVSFLTSPADLAALQSDPSYPLAHILVRALSPGTLVFDFVPTPFTIASDYLGTSIEGVIYQGASVTVNVADPPPSSVPEPDSWIMLLTGLCLMTLPRWKRLSGQRSAR